MSPRAASRLESLGFQRIFDYAAGKADWGAAGLPLEGGAGPRALEHARRDTPTCAIDEPLQEVRERVAASGWDTCVVVDGRGVVIGRLGRRALGREDAQTVRDAMREGPRTFRPSVLLGALVGWMRSRGLTTALVTRSDGTLVGLVRLDEAEAALADERRSRGLPL
jgi:CBS domain-containing protein